MINLFTSFGYFNSDEENYLFVKNAYEMLNKNGYYVLDYLNKNFVESNLIAHSKKSVGNKQIFEKRVINSGRVIKEIEILNEDQKHNYVESVKLYSYTELIEKFAKIGFQKRNVFGGYSGSEYDINKSKRCIIIFRK